MAMEITDPSMNPMLDARMAATSTKRRLAGEAMSWLMTGSGVDYAASLFARDIDRHLVSTRLAEMKPTATGEVEFWPRDYATSFDHPAFGIVEVIGANDRHGRRHLFRCLVDTAVYAGIVEAIVVRSITGNTPAEGSLEK